MLLSFGKLSSEERAPFVERVGTMLGDSCPGVRVQAIKVLDSCSADEWAPFLSRISRMCTCLKSCAQITGIVTLTMIDQSQVASRIEILNDTNQL